MNIDKAQLENALAIWIDNMLESPESYDEPVTVCCMPFDEIEQEHNASVTTMVQDGQLLVSVAADGSADVVWSGEFGDDLDSAEPAEAAVVVLLAAIE